MKPISQMTKEEFRSFLTNTDFNISDYVDEGNTADGFIYDYLKHLNINADRTDFICAIPSPEEGYNLRDLYVSSIDKFIVFFNIDDRSDSFSSEQYLFSIKKIMTKDEFEEKAEYLLKDEFAVKSLMVSLSMFFTY
jgi:hypothetical protein